MFIYHGFDLSDQHVSFYASSLTHVAFTDVSLCKKTWILKVFSGSFVSFGTNCLLELLRLRSLDYLVGSYRSSSFGILYVFIFTDFFLFWLSSTFILQQLLHFLLCVSEIEEIMDVERQVQR